MTTMFKYSCANLLSSPGWRSVLTGSCQRGLATHWNPRFKKIRKEKVVKVNLPDFEKMRSNDILEETAEERRSRFIKEGVEAPINFEYKPFNITTSNEIFDAYVPPKDDGKKSIFSKEFAGSKFEQIKKTVSKKFTHQRLIKKYEQTFEENAFADYAQQVYIDAHNALMNRDSEKLIQLVTEHAYPKMWVNMKFKTIRWKWLESLEAPSVEHMITREMLSKSNIYAQITILSVYDRFGRLAFGSDTLPKDVLEYIVFEKHISNPYGTWRLHDKIEPSWATDKTPIIRTFRQPKPFKVDEELNEVDVSKFKKDDSHLKSLEGEEQKPQKSLVQ